MAQKVPWADLIPKYIESEGVYADYVAFLEWFHAQDKNGYFEDIEYIPSTFLFSLFCECYQNRQ